MMNDEELAKRVGHRIGFYASSDKKILSGIFSGFKECKLKGSSSCNACKGYVLLHSIEVTENYREYYRDEEFIENGIKLWKGCLTFMSSRRTWKDEDEDIEIMPIKVYLKETNQKGYIHK